MLTLLKKLPKKIPSDTHFFGEWFGSDASQFPKSTPFNAFKINLKKACVRVSDLKVETIKDAQWVTGCVEPFGPLAHHVIEQDVLKSDIDFKAVMSVVVEVDSDKNEILYKIMDFFAFHVYQPVKNLK